MQIKEAVVQYKERSDYRATYMEMDDHTQYYFLPGGKLSNGNIIVSTLLVEAIDPLVVASHVGVINEKGDVIIPCENKSIKPVLDKALVVERAQPITESVLEAVRNRKDPLFATKLVTTPAMIKDKMNSLMGQHGRFVFNDQFSEATVCDLDGHNLLNNEYYSFICISDEILYFSKNVAGSDVLNYSFSQDHAKEGSKEETPLNVADAILPPGAIDHAIVSPEPVVESIPSASEEKEVNTPIPVVDLFHPVDSQKINSSSEFADKELEEVKEDDSKDEKQMTKEEKHTEMPFDVFSSQVVAPEVPPAINSSVANASIFPENLSFEKKEDSSDLNTEKNVDVDNKKDMQPPIIEETTSTLAKLIQQNKAQQEKIVSYEQKLNKIITQSQKIAEENDSYRERFEEMENQNKQLKSENSSLQSTVDEQRKVISTQEQEIASLKPQVEGKDELMKLLADAQVLLGGQNYSEEQEVNSPIMARVA